MHKKHLPFWFATISVFVALILPILLKDGISMDDTEKEHEYYLTDKSCDSSISEKYARIELSTSVHNLHQIK